MKRWPLVLFALAACGPPDYAKDRTASQPAVQSHANDATRTVHAPPAVPTRASAAAPWEFAPDTVSHHGATWRAFDRADADGCFDVVVQAPDGARWVVAESPRHQADANLASDGARLWIAFEVGGEDWGGGGPLRRERRVRFGALSTDAVPAFTPLPTPFARVEAEAPELTVDPSGRPWLFVRTLKEAATYTPDSKGDEHDEAANRRVAWVIECAVLTDEGWSEPITLPDSSGPQDGALELAWSGDALTASYFTDGRAERFIDDALTGPWDGALPGPGRWHTSNLRFPSGPGAPPLPKGQALALTPDRAQPAPRPPSALVWGDLHRHTDASRCKMNEDGDLLDAYRYALGTARLDFIAVTNHFQHMTREGWEREVATADAFNALDGFVAFVGYERALPIGHWTMVAAGPTTRPLSDGVFAPYRPRFLWDEHPASDWLAIPHQLTDRAAPLTWDQVGDLDPVVEVFQSRRGAYEARHGWRRDLGGDPEAKWAQDYLGEGRVLGFVASSDHATTTSAYTGVRLAPGAELTRANLIAAIRQRHTLAASTRADLDFTVTRPGGQVYRPGDVLELGPGLQTLELAFETDATAVTHLDVVHGRPGESPAVLSASTLTAEGPIQAELFLRLGRAKRERTVTLDVQGAELGDDLRAFALEPEDQLSGADRTTIRLESALDPRDEDGFLVPLSMPPGTAPKLTLTVQSPGKRFTKSLDLAKALDRPSELFWSAGARTDLRVDRLASGLSAAGTVTVPGARAGDWLYLRAITRSGDVLWTSPLFLR